MSILTPHRPGAQKRALVQNSTQHGRTEHRQSGFPPRRRYRHPLAPQPVRLRPVVQAQPQPETWEPMPLETAQESTPVSLFNAPLAGVRAEIQATWQGKIGGRMPVLESRRILRSLAVTLVVIFLVAGAARLLIGLQEKASSGNVADEQLAAAQAALKENNLEAALDLFDRVLAATPRNVVAQSGYAEAWRRMQLADTYSKAVTTLDAGHFEQALSILTEMEEAAPNYRDVRQLIQQAQNTLRVRQLYLEAESAYIAQQWETAVQTYESLRKIDGAYALEVVVPHLAEAYRRLGQQIVVRRPDQGADLNLARSYFDHALRTQPGEALAQQEADRLAQYNAAIAAYTAGDVSGMVALLEPLYAEHPAYLGGFMAEQLYAAYLQLGDEAAAVDDPAQASAWYDKAAGLQSVDASEAKLRSEALSTPPTPTAPPEPVAQAPVYAPAPPAPPTPTATPSGLEAYHGWIAFHTSRDGDAVIYLMQPDGSQQQRAPADAAARLDQLYSQQQWAIDGAQIFVANAPMRNDTNVYLARSGPPDSGGAVTREEVMLTDFPGLEYDPVWSPDGKTIAFVANHTYNDEIFTLVVDGGAPVQLTHNEWEWDKRPSWSPDGSQIVFYSNRSGQRQIWIMNADGSNQRNISNSPAEDWDPVWIR